MMMKFFILYLVCLFILWSGEILAQQQPDPSFIQQAIAVVQSQRNQALDAVAACQVQSNITAAEVAKLKERIAELEKGK